MSKKNLIIAAVVAVAALVIFLIVRKNKGEHAAEILATVKHGPFKIEIETTGELEAKNSVKIQGPTALRDFRIWNATIQTIIDEGTIVKKGDWVATLDRSEFQNRWQEKQIELDREEAEFTQTQLDTTLQLRQARDELINLKYAVEEKQIVLEQSQFEPPATIKQAEINLERSKREYQQALENYKIKKRQNAEKMRVQSTELRKVQNDMANMQKVSQEFTILAPEDGMVTYSKGWDQRPIKAGSQINTWDPVVATLPDLKNMVSKTYVNEVDIRKIKVGQKVDIGLDAYPDKRLTGKVTRVANVGEQRPNSDAKVFQVDIEINGSDPALRPAMTTSNKILASVVDNVLFIPLECLHSQADSITYVFKKDGLNIQKQEVIIGQTNSNEAVVLAGLAKGDKLYLSFPAGMENDKVNLLPEMNGKRKKPEPKEEEVEPAVPGVISGGQMPASPQGQPAGGEQGHRHNGGKKGTQATTSASTQQASPAAAKQ